MLKRLSIIVVLGILIVACNGVKRPEKPDNLISKAQMTDLLYDLYVMNAAKGVNRSSLEKNDLDPEFYILKKHNVDSARFAESNSYYAFDTEGYKEIVDNVKERLELEKERYEDVRQLETDSIKRRRDSIAKKRRTPKESNVKTNAIDTADVKTSKPKGS
ncbi:DUF4296 domain-containing protein [Winogradskyella psychrotolerans]|uniref:DUF4296 domain-containing protein n=1 Tax=Winogradskyella psychrotolerans TaxID=1344585 RepID=UPI001C07D188|nr:DUF4296 domain-containing protein [Winogradskyella psychrotolerans]MBU2927846.1 DUF4296 domain-containing protein [Winogradskyella psychrotolerans]